MDQAEARAAKVAVRMGWMSIFAFRFECANRVGCGGPRIGVWMERRGELVISEGLDELEDKRIVGT